MLRIKKAKPVATYSRLVGKKIITDRTGSDSNIDGENPKEIYE